MHNCEYIIISANSVKILRYISVLMYSIQLYRVVQ